MKSGTDNILVISHTFVVDKIIGQIITNKKSGIKSDNEIVNYSVHNMSNYRSVVCEN